jgi:predicted extracellular nuclease
MPRSASRFLVVAMATLLATGWVTATPSPAAAVSPTLVISQVYGAGGNVGATYQSDYIELYNRGATTVDLSTWSVQYAATAGTTWQRTNLTGFLGAGQHYLVREATGSSCGGLACGSPLPTPDASGSIPMAAGAGKVALLNSRTTITTGTSCPSTGVIDLVGYGTGTNCFEGTGPTGTISASTAALRAADGGTDTDSNSDDFTVGAPNPRSSGVLWLTINDVSHNESTGSQLYDFTVSLTMAAGLTGVTFDIATADNSATTANNDYAAQTLTNQTIPEGSSTYLFSVMVNGDTAFEPDESFFVNVTNVVGANVADAQGVGTLVNDDDAPLNVCGAPYTSIHAIQGGGASTPIPGDVSTEGIVIGDFEGTAAASGFYIQEPTPDADTNTSEGIYVFTGANTSAVNTGDRVRVTGFARERFTQTTINGSDSNTAPVTNIQLCSTGNPLPAPAEVLLPVTATSDFEKFEGMYVKFTQDLVIAEYFNYDQFGEVVLAQPLAGETRPFSGTSIDAPGAAANGRTATNLLSRIVLDDVQSAQNPTVLRHPNGLPFSLTNAFRGGDHVQNAIGVMGYDFNLYRLLPTAGADYTALNARPAAPADTHGRLTVAAQNTLNFFITADYPTGDPLDNKCGPANTLECRGWDSDQSSEFTRQRDKLLATLSGLDADVIGLNEIENSGGVDPLGDPTNGIVAGLNGIFGAGTYASIDTGTIGTDAIKVGLIYRPAAVTPVGAYKLLTTAVDARFIDTRSRPVLAQTFVENATGERFTVAVNHLKSKGSGCADIGDPDALDGQGNCNVTRTKAAKALVDWLAADPTASGDPDFLIIGDLNSYAREDPITAVKAGPDDTLGTPDDYTNLVNKYLGTYAYSYTFDGQAGYLDHALSSATMTGQVSGVAEWHINSDEADVFDYDTTFKPPSQEALYEAAAYRSSDHDGVIVGLNLVGLPTTITINAGDDQSTVAGTDFGTKLDLTVSDSEGNPVAGAAVTFAAPTSGASASIVETGPYLTDAEGRLVVTGHAGTTAGGQYDLVATSGTGTATFHLTNLAGDPDHITINSGDARSTSIDTDFGTPLDLTVLDANDNPVPNATVTFAGPLVGASATTVESGPYTTDAAGNLVVTAHANAMAGGPYDFVATAGAATATFHLTNVASSETAQLSSSATCSTFVNGTAPTLTQITYGANKGKINAVSEGSFSYWAEVTAAAGSNTFTIDQEITTGNFTTLFALASGSNVFKASCSGGIKATFAQVTTSGSAGAVTVSFIAPTAGTYEINVKLSTNTVKGGTPPSPTTVHYLFSTSGVAGSARALDLVKP